MNDAVKQKLADLSARFGARANEYRRALAAAVAADDRAMLAAEAHKLAGIAAMFGHPRIGEAALALEQAAEGDAAYADEMASLDLLLAEISVPTG